MPAPGPKKVLPGGQATWGRGSRALIAVVVAPFFLDQLNGLLQKGFGAEVSVSQWIKALYVAPLLPLAILESAGACLAIVTLCVALALSFVSAQACNTAGVPALFPDLVFLTKLLTFPITYYGFVNVLRSRPEDGRAIQAATTQVLFFGIAVALVLAYLGFGGINYGFTESGAALGYRGYFIAGNELTALFVLAYALAFGEAVERAAASPRAPVIVMVVGLATALLLFTKAGLLAYLLTSAVIPTLARRRRRAEGAAPRRGLGASLARFAVGGIALLGVFLWAADRIQANLDRFNEKLGMAGDFASFLASGRLEAVEVSLRMYTDAYSTPAKWLGCGWAFPEYLNTYAYFGPGSAEMDHVDLLVSIGAVGTLVVYAVWLAILLGLRRAQHRRPSLRGAVMLYAMALLMGLGVVSGHVMYSALTGFYLAVAAAVVTCQGNAPGPERLAA